MQFSYSPVGLPLPASGSFVRTLVQQAYMLGTNDTFWLWGWVLLALIALTRLTWPPFVARRTARASE
jgi:hypothetical protein